jgi:hypothetical protein
VDAEEVTAEVNTFQLFTSNNSILGGFRGRGGSDRGGKLFYSTS